MTKENTIVAAQECAKHFNVPAVYFQVQNGQWMHARKVWADSHRTPGMKLDTLVVVYPPNYNVPKYHDEDFEHAARRAEAAFWEAVVKCFPEIKTGDLDSLTATVFQISCIQVITAWVQTNMHDETFTERQEAYRKDHPNAEEPF